MHWSHSYSTPPIHACKASFPRRTGGHQEGFGARRHRRRAAAAPGRPALVQGDARTPFAAMTRALEAVGEAGITEVRFAAEPVESK